MRAMNEQTGSYSIGEAARAAGLTAKTVRYYESIGLIPKAARRAVAAGTEGSRFYGEVDIGRLRFIRQAREVDLGLPEIRALLKIADAGCPSAQPAYAEVLRRHVRSVEERINRLLGLRSAVHRLLSKTKSEGSACCTWKNCACMRTDAAPERSEASAAQ